MNQFPQTSGQRRGILGGARQHFETGGGPRMLDVWHVNLRAGRLVQPVLAHVGHHAHDGHELPAVQPHLHPFAKRVLASERLAATASLMMQVSAAGSSRSRSVKSRPRRSGIPSVSKIAWRHQHEARLLRDEIAGLGRGASFNQIRAVAARFAGEIARGRYHLDARQMRGIVQQPFVKPHGFRRACAVRCGRHRIHGEQSLSSIARVRVR